VQWRHPNHGSIFYCCPPAQPAGHVAPCRPRIDERLPPQPTAPLPLEDFQDALAIGGTVRSFCGIEVVLLAGDTSDVLEATAPDAEDCVTCVDIWRERGLVRL